MIQKLITRYDQAIDLTSSLISQKIILSA